MFSHSLTNTKYYSVREKIKYYKEVIKGKIKVSAKTKRKAKLRLKTLLKINEQSYDEPRLIITDDTHFKNPICKPRLCVAYGEDKKKRIRVFPIYKRTSDIVLIDNNLGRQVHSKYKWLDRSDVYEVKNLSNIKPLSKGTKILIKDVLGNK